MTLTKDEALRLAVEVLELAEGILQHADCSTGYCCCGSSVKSHTFGDGHSPVDEGSYAQIGAMKRLKEALPLLRTASEQPVRHKYVLELPQGDERQAVVVFSEYKVEEGCMTHHLCVNVKPTTPPSFTLPEGWQLVPVQPTPEMCKAGYMARDKWPNQMCDNNKELHMSFSEPRWKAMLDAAPQKGTTS